MNFKLNLEAKFVQLEKVLMALQIQQPIISQSIHSDDIVAIKDNDNRISVKNSVLRTCRETRAADPSLISGKYWIDPDGQGVGDDPIYVYCNMATGSTEILHDSELKTDVGNCADPGCYSKAVNYNSTMRQMSALVDLSNECHQSIRVRQYYLNKLVKLN